MMDEPLRLRFLKGMTEVLSAITPLNGYKHDLSESVFRGRLTFGDTDPLPMLSLIEPPIMPPSGAGPLGADAHQMKWDVIVQGFVDDDPRNPTDPAHYLLADTKRALAEEAEKLQRVTYNSGGELIFGIPRKNLVSIEAELGFVRPSDDISSKAYFWLPLHICFVENWRKPYD